LGPNSQLLVEIFGGGTGQYDFITVTGSATVLGSVPVNVLYTASYGDNINIMTFGPNSFIQPNNLTILGGTSNQGIAYSANSQNMTLYITNKQAIYNAQVAAIVTPILIAFGIAAGLCIITIVMITIGLCCLIITVLTTGYAIRKVLRPMNVDVQVEHLDI